MSEEIKDEEVVEQPKVEDADATLVDNKPEETEEEKKLKEEMLWREQGRDLAVKIFKENLAASDLPFMVIEIIPDFLKSLVQITKGKSKKWEEKTKMENEFYETPIKDLELYEDIEESKIED